MRLSSTLLAVALVWGCSTDFEGDPGTEPDRGPQSDSDPGDVGPCASVNVAVEAEIPTVMLLIDASGSMLEPFGNTWRGAAVFDTLMNPETGVVKVLEDSVSFGLSLYASVYDPYGWQVGPCPQTVAVAPSLGNHQQLHDTFGSVSIYSHFQTPTGPALRDATSRLASAPLDRPRAIVLATDGEPNDVCAGGYTNAIAAAREASLQAVEAAQEHDIQTYVISVGDDIAEQHLQQLANTGVGLPRSGAERAPFYKALDPAQLVDAFQSIVAGVRTCEFRLDRRIDLVHAQTGMVTLNGRPLEFETEWDMVDSMTLELLGAACDEWKRAGDNELAAEFTCTAIID